MMVALPAELRLLNTTAPTSLLTIVAFSAEERSKNSRMPPLLLVMWAVPAVL